MADGFLGRWSRRKLDAKEGKPLDPEPPPPAREPEPASVAARPAVAAVPPAPVEQPVVAEPPPTMDDVHGLTPESDFARFVRPDVTPEVKNAAVKKLFADPRFNVQDGLDVYIDDYNKPDPIPEAMLRNLAGNEFLGLFRHEERKDEAAGQARDDAERLGHPSVAQSASGPPAHDAAADPSAVPPDHADPDLRLQQDDAAGPSGPRHDAG